MFSFDDVNQGPFAVARADDVDHDEARVAVCEERAFDVRDMSAANTFRRTGPTDHLVARVISTLKDLKVVIMSRDIERWGIRCEGRFNRSHDLAIAVFVSVLKCSEDQKDGAGNEVCDGTA